MFEVMKKKNEDYRPKTIGDLFDSFFDEPFFQSSILSSLDEKRGLGIEISEDKEKYYVEADVPGMEKDDIHIEVQNGMLVIEGERKVEEEKKDRTFYRTRSYGKIRKSISIPENAALDEIDAEFKNGVLKIIFKKKEEQNNIRKIEIR